MRTRTLSLVAVLTAFLLTPARTAADEAPGTIPKGFTALFNGKDLRGWHGWAIHEKNAGPRDMAKLSPEERQKKIDAWTADAKKHWSVENGELVNDGHGAYLATDKEFGDIELLIDYKTVPKADSGIYLKATPQVQIWDYTKEGGKWNHFRIIQVGARTTIWLNGKLVVDNAILENYWDRKKPLFSKGGILLQTHGGEIRCRNIYYREIPPQEANRLLNKHSDKGFVSVFDGKSFDGWAGP